MSSYEEPETAQIRILKETIEVRPFKDLLGKGPDVFRKLLEVPALKIEREAPRSSDVGYVDLHTGNFSHSAKISLTSKDVSAIKMLGVDEIDVLIYQSGRINISDSHDNMPLKAYIDFSVVTQRSSEEHVIIKGRGRKGCSTTVGMCATVDGSTCTEKEVVRICPGDPVYLWWESSDDVKIASITPDVGDVKPTGSTRVHPQHDTTYTITVRGDCELTDSVYVQVIEGVKEIDLMVPYVYRKETFYISIPKQFTSSKLFVRTLRPVCGLGCFVHQPPILYYDYLACGAGLCNADWLIEKTDYDGNFHALVAGNFKLPVDFPFGGEWIMEPRIKLGPLTGYAFFKLTVGC